MYIIDRPENYDYLLGNIVSKGVLTIQNEQDYGWHPDNGFHIFSLPCIEKGFIYQESKNRTHKYYVHQALSGQKYEWGDIFTGRLSPEDNFVESFITVIGEVDEWGKTVWEAVEREKLLINA